jgi:hypothetical protein
VVPCRAGVLNAVVYSNGDVSVCQEHAPLGNLRQKSFGEIWNSPQAQALRKSIAAKACHCTNEVFLWPSLTYQPQHLVRAMIGARVWQGVKPLAADEKVKATADDGAPSLDTEKLISITSGGRS